MAPIGFRGIAKYAAWIALVAAAYVLFAKLGFSLAFTVAQVTAVWPPTGIAVAALVLGGSRMWPGVFLGALLANASSNEPILTAAAIAAGNTLGPLLGAYLLRVFHFDRSFARVRDALVFVAFASVAAMTVTATNGTLQLVLAHIAPWSSFGSVWALWWTGDAMGVLLVAPLILTWSDFRRDRNLRGEAGTLEVVVLILAAFAAAGVQFLSKLPVAFPLYPLVVWAAMRVGARVTTATICAVVMLAVWGTVHDLGPFRTGTLDQRLMELVWFTAVLSIMGLVLSALTAERRFALAQMQVAERRFQVLAETLPQIVWTADASGTIDWLNQRWYQYTGESPDEPVAWHWPRVSHPDDLAAIEADWQRGIAAREPFEMEFRLRRSDGVYRWFLARAEPMRDRRGRLVRWYGTHTDIDDQRRALERSARVVQTLQSAFLPESLPTYPNLRFDALYLTARYEALIGGDWYDAFTLPDGRVIVSIGDVAGHGLSAAVNAARIRQSIVATAVDTPDPAAILSKVNRLVQLRDSTIATALVALVDPDERTMRYAAAGHPPPILASAQSKARSLQYGSLPLGVDAATEYANFGANLDADSIVLFYTDGVTEFQRDIDAAERGLCEAVDALVAAQPSAHPAEVLRAAVMGDATPSDDAVLMVMHVAPVSADLSELSLRRTWSFHSSHSYSAHSARHEVMSFIHRHAGEEQDVFGAELILGEILANTVEHAPGPVNMEIDWSDVSPVVTVVDTGPGLARFAAELPEDALTEDGRGLFLVKALARDVRVESAQGYGTKMTVVLPIARRE